LSLARVPMASPATASYAKAAYCVGGDEKTEGGTSKMPPAPARVQSSGPRLLHSLASRWKPLAGTGLASKESMPAIRRVASGLVPRLAALPEPSMMIHTKLSASRPASSALLSSGSRSTSKLSETMMFTPMSLIICTASRISAVLFSVQLPLNCVSPNRNAFCARCSW